MFGTVERLRDDDGKFRAQTYEVTVWDNMNGDVTKYISDATKAEVDDVEQYYDEPMFSIEIKPND